MQLESEFTGGDEPTRWARQSHEVRDLHKAVVELAGIVAALPGGAGAQAIADRLMGKQAPPVAKPEPADMSWLGEDLRNQAEATPTDKRHEHLDFMERVMVGGPAAAKPQEG